MYKHIIIGNTSKYFYWKYLKLFLLEIYKIVFIENIKVYLLNMYKIDK